MGGGFKYCIKEDLYIGLEILHRKTFTDYIDDVGTNYIDPIYFFSIPGAGRCAYRLSIAQPGAIP